VRLDTLPYFTTELSQWDLTIL